MRIRYIQVLGLLAFLTALPILAQQGQGNECTPAGVWYGGSVVAYHMTVIPAGPAGNYVVTGQGMYKNSVMNTTFTGMVTKNGKKYEGTIMNLTTQELSYGGPPPYSTLPDIYAGWSSMEMLDCNTIRNTIPVFGIYFAHSVWNPGNPVTGVAWISGGKVPLVDPPDVNLIPILTKGLTVIVETYHRLPEKVNQALVQN